MIRTERLTVLATALLAPIYFHWPVLGQPLAFSEDVVQHYLWLATIYHDVDWGDPFYAEASRVIQPWGFRALLRVLVTFLEPVTISRWLPPVVMALTIALGQVTLRRFYAWPVALAGAVLIAVFAFPDTLGYLARGNVALLLMGLAYLVTGPARPWALAAYAVVCALFYPPVLLIMGGVMVGWFIYRSMVERRVDWRYWLPVALGGAVAVGVTWFYSQSVASSLLIGSSFNYNTLAVMPEFGRGGRVNFRIYHDLPVEELYRYFLRELFIFGYDSNWAFVWMGGGLTVGWFTARRLMIFVLTLGVSTSLLFVLACRLLPLLFLPDRYIDYPWMVFVPMVYILAIGCIRTRLPDKLSMVVATTLLLFATGYKWHSEQLDSLVLGADLNPIMTAIRELPQGALIAGPPIKMNFVPLLAHRAVLVSLEASHALYFKRYYAHVDPRMRDQVAAFSATDPLTLVSFLDRWRVDYLMVDRLRLKYGDHFVFNPHTEVFQERLKGVEPRDLAMLQLPDSLGTIIEDRYHLVSREEVSGWARSRGRR